MGTFLVIGGIAAFVALCVWASRGEQTERVSGSLSGTTVHNWINRVGQIDPSALDNADIDEDSLPYAYLWRGRVR